CGHRVSLRNVPMHEQKSAAAHPPPLRCYPIVAAGIPTNLAETQRALDEPQCLSPCLRHIHRAPPAGARCHLSACPSSLTRLPAALETLLPVRHYSRLVRSPVFEEILHCQAATIDLDQRP